MSVLLVEPNKNGKYEFTKKELQDILDRVEQEAFERGLQCGKRMQEPKEKEYVYINSPSLNPLNPCVNWNEVTCKTPYTVDDPMDKKTVYTTKSTCIGTDPMDIN